MRGEVCVQAGMDLTLSVQDCHTREGEMEKRITSKEKLTRVKLNQTLFQTDELESKGFNSSVLY